MIAGSSFVMLELALALVSPAPSQEVYRFGVEVRTAYVDVFVTRDGKAVTGLNVENFEVLDNGVSRPVDLVDPQMMPLSSILILDTSQSVTGEKLQHLRSAAHAFAEGLQQQDESGLLTFSHLWQLREELGDDLDSLHQALDQPMETGLTGLNDALYAGLKLVGEGEGRPMVLLFTDGLDNASWLTDEELLDVVRESAAVIHVVGIQSPADASLKNNTEESTQSPIRASRFLRELASATGGRTWFADGSENLKEAFLGVLEEMETRYLLSYQIQEPIEEGWHSLEVKLKNVKADEIRSRTGYLLTQNEKR